MQLFDDVEDAIAAVRQALGDDEIGKEAWDRIQETVFFPASLQAAKERGVEMEKIAREELGVLRFDFEGDFYPASCAEGHHIAGAYFRCVNCFTSTSLLIPPEVCVR